MPEWRNQLWFGDNLDILRNHVEDGAVDLVYLDPPFNSNATYNVLFDDKPGVKSQAQSTAFKDTWEWDDAAWDAYRELVRTAPPKLRELMEALHKFLTSGVERHGNQMFAYLVMMAQRLDELHRKLKPTGSLYLHCDPPASPYIQLVLDAVFGYTNFRNEISWKRTYAHGNVSRRFGDVTDTIYWYTRSEEHTWNQQWRLLDSDDIRRKYPNVDATGRRWQSVTLRNPGKRPNLHFPYAASNGITYQPHPNGWSCNMQRLQRYDREGRLHFPAQPHGALRLKMFADESEGERLQSLWDDIRPIGAQAHERLGYPTQKPEALLERIISASSNEGDLVLDPFCGCGTTVAVAERLNRRWIGVDVTYAAVDLMERRLLDQSTPASSAKPSALPVQQRRRALERHWAGAEKLSLADLAPFEVRGDPKDLASARSLSERDPFQFQWWCCAMVGARGEERRGADKGIDGIIVFEDPPKTFRKVLVSVKGGKVQREMVATLKGDMERESADLGVLITLDEPTKPMKDESLASGVYASSTYGGREYRKVQLLSVADIFGGERVAYPLLADTTYRRARRRPKLPPGTQLIMEPMAVED